MWFYQMVNTEALVRNHVFNEIIRESIDVTRRFENRFYRQCRAVNFEHLIFQYEISSPHLQQIGFQCASNWPQIVEAARTTVDFIALVVNKPSPHENIEFCSIDWKCLRVDVEVAFLKLKENFFRNFEMRKCFLKLTFDDDCRSVSNNFSLRRSNSSIANFNSALLLPLSLSLLTRSPLIWMENKSFYIIFLPIFMQTKTYLLLDQLLQWADVCFWGWCTVLSIL